MVLAHLDEVLSAADEPGSAGTTTAPGGPGE
jgi:hypothetical protein